MDDNDDNTTGNPSTFLDLNRGGAGGDGGLSTLEQDVLDEYARLARNMKTVCSLVPRVSLEPEYKTRCRLRENPMFYPDALLAQHDVADPGFWSHYAGDCGWPSSARAESRERVHVDEGECVQYRAAAGADGRDGPGRGE
jgi:hypothetical protein